MAVSERTSSLRGVGQGVVLGVPDSLTTPRAMQFTPRDLGGVSIQDMESSLHQKFGKRPPDADSARCVGLRARALLEENRQMIMEKKERKAMARQHSKEEFDKLIVQDRLSSEGEKAMALHKRTAQRELAQHYKERIGTSLQSKVHKYNCKRDGCLDVGYFPFVEGENIIKDRRAKGEVMREEMRGFLRQQRQENPPRCDRLVEDAGGLDLDYPLDPLGSARANGAASVLPRPASASAEAPAVGEVALHMSRHPRFLSRASEHMSRRLQDVHVRKALEEKVMQTKAELEAKNSMLEKEKKQWSEGMQVNDALRYDREQTRNADKRRNAEELRLQMEEQRGRAKDERQAHRVEKAGYYGPEERGPLDPVQRKNHCSDLIRQMEVDQLRRHRDRGHRIRQEKQIIDNCMAEMSQDRQKDIMKHMQHREVLTSTWESQRQIRKAMDSLEQI